jgi:hypothetical protein
MVNGFVVDKDIFFFPGGAKYFYNYENRIFFWEEDSLWEGTFNNNK